MLTPSGWSIYYEIGRILQLVGLIKADKYDRFADELANLLIGKWDEITRESIGDMVRTLRGLSGKPKPADMDEQIETLALRLGPQFANKVAAPLFDMHLEAFTEGKKDVKASFAATFNLVDERAIEALHQHNVYWARDAFDANFRTLAEAFGARVIREGMTFRQAGDLFENEFAEQYGAYGTNYWRGVAANIVTRSREIGHVNGYEEAGVEYIEVRAVLDHRTSKICREMHGRVIAMEKTVQMRDELLAAKTPDEVKKIAPWQKEDFVRGKKTKELPHGLSLPPYHFRCRSITVAADTTTTADVVAGNKIPTADKKLLNSLTPLEHWNRVAGMNGKRWNAKDFAEDVQEHAGEFGLDENGYRLLAEETVRTADRIVAKMYNGDMQYHFFSKETGGIAYMDMSGRVRGLYGHKNMDKAFAGLKRTGLWLKPSDRN